MDQNEALAIIGVVGIVAFFGSLCFIVWIIFGEGASQSQWLVKETEDGGKTVELISQ